MGCGSKTELDKASFPRGALVYIQLDGNDERCGGRGGGRIEGGTLTFVGWYIPRIPSTLGDYLGNMKG